MPRSTATDRALRRRRLLEMLQTGFEGTQEEIVRRLQREGFAVTQATVSRDLEALGAVRRHSTYGMPATNGPPMGWGRRVLSELVVEVAASGNMVVVRTFPGMASSVAAILDASELPGALGTIAGDDTVFLVADAPTGGRRLAASIRKEASS